MKTLRKDSTIYILPIEYTLAKNPLRGPSSGTIQRIYYHVSLLDCASPDIYSAGYTANDATGLRNVAELTDYGAATADHEVKVEKCPGYQQEITVTFSNDTVCEPIQCSGKEKCEGIYMFDRTRKDELSQECREEYRRDMVVDLRAENTSSGKNGTW
jgi:hypothetical protein